MGDLPKKMWLTVLALVLCLMVFAHIDEEHAFGELAITDSIDMTIDIVNDGPSETLVKNTVLEFVNATPVPLDVSLPAFDNHFQNARFTLLQDSAYLRASYDSILDPNDAQTYADVVLAQFRASFNLTMNVIRRTTVPNNETSTTDVYYQIGGIPWNLYAVQEFSKYHPTDGFGSLITRDLLSFYLQGGPDADHYGIFLIECNVLRSGAQLLWKLRLELNRQVTYDGATYLDVNLNFLLNRSETITLPNQRAARVQAYIGKKEVFSNTPVYLTINSSSPPYTNLREVGDYVVASYDITVPIDNLQIGIKIGPNGPLNLALILSICIFAAIASLTVGSLLLPNRRRSRGTTVRHYDSDEQLTEFRKMITVIPNIASPGLTLFSLLEMKL